jgi:hypothetical protein
MLPQPASLARVGLIQLPTFESDGKIIPLVGQCCLPGKASPPICILKDRFLRVCKKYDLKLGEDYCMPDFDKLRKLLPSVEGITKSMYVLSPRAFSYACLPQRLVARPDFEPFTSFKVAADEYFAISNKVWKLCCDGSVHQVCKPPTLRCAAQDHIDAEEPLRPLELGVLTESPQPASSAVLDIAATLLAMQGQESQAGDGTPHADWRACDTSAMKDLLASLQRASNPAFSSSLLDWSVCDSKTMTGEYFLRFNCERLQDFASTASVTVMCSLDADDAEVSIRGYLGKVAPIADDVMVVIEHAVKCDVSKLHLINLERELGKSRTSSTLTSRSSNVAAPRSTAVDVNSYVVPNSALKFPAEEGLRIVAALLPLVAGAARFPCAGIAVSSLKQRIPGFHVKPGKRSVRNYCNCLV